jgi:hypothetical protein
MSSPTGVRSSTPSLIALHRASAGWRIDRFIYQLTVIDGNADLT